MIALIFQVLVYILLAAAGIVLFLVVEGMAGKWWYQRWHNQMIFRPEDCPGLLHRAVPALSTSELAENELYQEQMAAHRHLSDLGGCLRCGPGKNTAQIRQLVRVQQQWAQLEAQAADAELQDLLNDPGPQ